MILIVEPSKYLGGLIKEAFESAGLKSEVANSAQQAVHIADKLDSIEAVTIELLLPKHNGLEFLYEFRSYEDWNDTPIIIYSHLSDEELKIGHNLSDEMGIFARLYKPSTTLKTLVLITQASIAKHEIQRR